MAKQRTSRERKEQKRVGQSTPESPAVEALTTAWALCVLTTMVVEVGAATTRLLAIAYPQAAPLALFSGLLYFASVVLGCGTLMLLVLVLRLRRVRPPRPFVVLATVVGAVPLIALALQLLWRR